MPPTGFTFALTIDGRGFTSKVATGAEDFFSSECVSCGACVQACPTATLMEKSVIEHGVPDKSVVTTCAYCGVGCGVDIQLENGQAKAIKGSEDHPANFGRLCVKGSHLLDTIDLSGRLLNPQIDNGTYGSRRRAPYTEQRRAEDNDDVAPTHQMVQHDRRML